MFRPALLVLALVALSASTSVTAKTSISSLQQNEMPCPANSTESAVVGGSATSPSVTPATVTVAPAKISNRLARQRWKALLPGTMKSTS